MHQMAHLPPAKKRRLTPPDTDEDAESSAEDQNLGFAKWNLEQDYEQRPRKLQKKKENTKLPVKTADGWAEQEKDEEGSENEQIDGIPASEEEDSDEGAHTAKKEQNLNPTKSERQQILEAKEELARIASLVNEDPEEHIGSLRTLSTFAKSDNVVIKKLALAAQAAIYKDIIPGYRIRPLSEEDMTTKLSKEVRKLRNFEQSLVGGYQEYVKDLAQTAKVGRGSARGGSNGLDTIAISCACNLLNAVPHFNFRGDLLKILVDRLSTKRVDDNFHSCQQALETLFRDDEDGNASLEAVTLITKMIKARDFNVHEGVLNTFLCLRLLSEFSHKGSNQKVDTSNDASSSSISKKLKEKREFRTKKQRKMLKERKELEKEMKEADAVVGHEERDRMQGETLKLVFVTYFRILKARTPSLMGAVLEGLAKYAHLINQDFFGDILEALKDLISASEARENQEDEEEDDQEEENAPRNATRESLLCVITAFALLEGQDTSKAAAALHLDLGFFVTHLYRTLHPVCLNPDLELSSKSLRLPDPNAPEDQSRVNKVNVQTTAVLLLRSLTSVLLPPQALRAVPPVRIAAFSKQLMTASLHLPEKSCLAMMGLMTQVTKIHGKKIASLWISEERKGDGVFDALRGAVEGSNPFASTVWEGEILRNHFSPKVRDATKILAKNILESKS